MQTRGPGTGTTGLGVAPRGTQQSGGLPGRGFTLLELLMVIAIIGIISSMTMPALRGLMRTNAITAANRQLLDDLAAARLRAINGRSTVYVVFLPPNAGTNALWKHFATLKKADTTGNQARVLSNLFGGQFTSYAVLSKRTLGDQPGGDNKRYLTEWKNLPDGVFIRTNKFGQIPPARWLASDALTRPFLYKKLPFPTAKSPEFALPYIAFNSQGQLVYEDMPVKYPSSPGEFIPLTRGSVICPKGGVGVFGAKSTVADMLDTYLDVPPDVVDFQARDYAENFNYVRLDWLTGRARVERPEVSP